MDNDSAPPPRSRFRRRALITAACLLAGLVLAGSAGWYYRLALAERVILATLATKGISPARLRVDRLTLNEATVSAIALGPDQAQRIERVDVSYSVAGLRQGAVTAIRIKAPRLQARLVDGRFELPGLGAMMDRDSAGDATPLRIASLTADDFNLSLATPLGDVAVTGRAIATTSIEGLLEIAATYAVDATENPNKVRLRGSAAATLLPSGEVIGRVTLVDGEIQAAEDGVEGIHGEAQILGHGNEFSVDATIIGERIRLRGNIIEPATLTAGLTFGDSGIRIDTKIDAAEGHAALAGTVLPTPEGGYAYDGSLAAGLDLPNITARLDGTLRAAALADGKIEGRMDIVDAILALDDIGFEAAGVSGEATFAQSGAGLPDGAGVVNFERIKYAGLVTEKATLTFERSAGTTTVLTGFSSTNGDTVSVNASLAPDQILSFDAIGYVAPGPVLDALAVGVRTAGRIRFDLSGTLAYPWAVPETIPDRLTVDGSVTPDLTNLLVPGLLRDGSLKGAVRIIAKPGDWEFSSPSIKVSNARIAPELLQTLPAALRQHAANPVTIELRASDKPQAELRITPREGGYAATFSGTARATSGSVVLTVTGQGESTLPIAVAGGSGEFHLTGTHKQSAGDDIAPVTIPPVLNGSFTLKDSVLTARTGAASHITVDSVVMPGQFHTTAPLQMTIAQPFNLRADLGRQPVQLSYDGSVTLRHNRFTITAGQEPTELLLSDIPARIEGRESGFSVSIGPWQAELPGHALQASGIAVKLAVSDVTTVNIDIGEIRQKTPAPVVIPMQMQASAVLENSLAQFSAHLHDRSETISIRATGEHDLAQARGFADVKSSRITFLPTVLQPANLFPVIGKQLQDTDGYLEARASLQWQDGAIESGAEILADITAMKTEDVQLEKATTVITFDSLFPLSTPPGQEIYVGKLDIGIPLTAGRIEFQANRAGHITAALRELDMFGGRIETKVFTIPAKLDGFTIPLEVNGVRLDSLLAATKVGDLEATGTLNGQIPVVFEDGRIFLRNGILESAPGGGYIRYQPEEVGPALSDANEGTALFLDIVRDFQYDSVRVTIDEKASGDIPFEFKIKGRNPTVYKGIPVELNLSLSGPLRAILQQGLKTYTLPDRLLERMQDFDKP